MAGFVALANTQKSVPRKLFFVFCLIMYLVSFTHFGLNVYTMLVYNTHVQSVTSSAALCTTQLAYGLPTCDLDYAAASRLATASPGSSSQVNSCTSSTLLAVNIVLGDSIVLWRACAVWRHKRLVHIISVLLMVATVVTLSLSTWQGSCLANMTSKLTQISSFPLVAAQSDVYNLIEIDAIGNEFDDTFGAASIGLSWASNLWATGLLSLKAWKHHSVMKSDFAQSGFHSRSEKVLFFFVESGALYVGLWTMLLAASIIEWNHRAVTSAFMEVVLILKSSLLIDFIGIYPTALIVLVAFTRSHYEHTLRYSAVPTPHLVSAAPSERVSARDAPPAEADVATHARAVPPTAIALLRDPIHAEVSTESAVLGCADECEGHLHPGTPLYTTALRTVSTYATKHQPLVQINIQLG
ncbi:hypothetical protein PHLGIDRAFT_122826 [Phlebiopsis gigantea 11061_1 CR5-6]|uniref:Uncharacterized protein n=1 Tax=Phlebiopsis gigantea (strain 11061_1 CR5-6) TaxID=745531 RepID=A0A0C3RZS1_PHLG1|nr:hypothetical protein PHLGIDRAFT_122826 [Phlebiopsis gigantea 11061_1 CR5-6]